MVFRKVLAQISSLACLGGGDLALDLYVILCYHKMIVDATNQLEPRLWHVNTPNPVCLEKFCERS